MPHFRLEFSTNILEEPDPRQLLSGLHKLLHSFGSFPLSSMKSRIVPCSRYFVSDGERDQAFIHLELALLSGRDAELRQRLASELLNFLKAVFAQTAAHKICSFTVEVREMEVQTYAKELTNG